MPVESLLSLWWTEGVSCLWGAQTQSKKKAENQFTCTAERKKRRKRSVWPSWQYLQKQSSKHFILVLWCSWIKTGPLNINTYCISNSQYTHWAACCFHSLWRLTQMRSTWPRWGQPDPVKVQQRQSDHTRLISDCSNSAGLRENLPANWTVLEHDATSTFALEPSPPFNNSNRL